MKKKITIFFILCSFVCLCQTNGTVTINWTDKAPVSFGAYKIITPQFDSQYFYLDSYKKSLLLRVYLIENAPIDATSLQIANVVYESISQFDLGDLKISEIPSVLNPVVINCRARNQNAALITMAPIIKEGTGFKKLKTFSYSLNSSTAKNSKQTDDFNTVSNSVLATGTWHRFFVQKSGVYKLDKSFLSNIGVNMDGVDPKKIKIFGNGGRMIPLKNSDYYPADLTENAIQVSGENDGIFNDQDAVLFYAEGVDNWNTDSKTSTNLYDSKSYYYINIEGQEGKRITNNSQPVNNATISISEFDEYQYHEIDLVNIVRLGRTWFGEQFDIDNEQDFDFNIPNIDITIPINLTIYGAAASYTSTSFTVKANGQEVSGNLSFSPIDTYTLAKDDLLITTIPATENTRITLKYNNNGVPDSKGYLDYIKLKATKKLLGYGKQFRFQYDLASSSTEIGEYQITNATSLSQIWDITDIYNVTKFDNLLSNTFSFKALLGEVRNYIAVCPTDYYIPSMDTQSLVQNQDLKGTIFKNNSGQFEDVDYLIITPQFLGAQAEKLAVFHRNYSRLNVKVVYLENIYQEFCSGKQDIGAIRNFVKYVYNNASSPDKKVKYLNLFGDASYDFKNRIAINSNIVPIYHALNSFSLGESSFASDDYFGMMDDNEGFVDYSNRGLDIAVGRMIANTTTQADELVNKVLEYYDVKSYGNWRNNYVCVADDPDPTKTEDKDLQFYQNRLADKIALEKPFLNVKKILLDSYVQETSAGGNRYPKAREDFFNAFENGALVFNYLGHGGEDGLAQERIWEKSDGQTLYNRYKYPLFITITCQFSRFDNPLRPTAGEYTYWNPKGGAISMITTVREIGQTTGERFNDVLGKYLFSYGSNQFTSIAEALRLTKNDPFAPGTNVVFYLGDPALMLAIPQPKIILTKINDMPVSGPIDDLKSLSHIKLTGQVTDENNNLTTSYNGNLSVQIYDKNIISNTLANDGANATISISPNVVGPTMPFTILGETIFRGNATVTNGQFEFGFVVPRDIAIPIGNGRISFYAKENQLLLDKTGIDTSIKIGGVNENATTDNIAPKVKLYMNDQNFISGGITNQSPIFIAYLEDENGINTASGIGHDIIGVLDGNVTNSYKLNDYYETELDNYKKGKLKFPFRNLTIGMHTITFKAWDVYNNLVTSEIQFTVVGNESVTLTNVLNYPNPFVNYTEFWFTHNKPFEPLEVQVQVITVTGKVVWTKNQTVTTDGFLSREIIWDGKDDFGDKIGKGVYIYKLTVKSILTNSQTEKYEKLVIL